MSRGLPYHRGLKSDRVDRFMAVRMMTYIGLLYEALIKERLLAPDRRLPLVIPIVLYNGDRIGHSRVPRVENQPLAIRGDG